MSRVFRLTERVSWSSLAVTFFLYLQYLSVYELPYLEYQRFLFCIDLFTACLYLFRLCYGIMKVFNFVFKPIFLSFMNVLLGPSVFQFKAVRFK